MTDVGWFSNPDAKGWRSTPPGPGVLRFHRSLPGYTPTRLVDLPGLAVELGVARVVVKEESARLGLPAFKVLGAAYAIARSLSARLGAVVEGGIGADDRALPLDELSRRTPDLGPLRLVAATDGNHGRAVAHVARMLGLPATIFFPASITSDAKAAIAGEGAQTIELDLQYDDLVDAARRHVELAGAPALLVQDTGWSGYHEIPGWIVDGYATLFTEADAQLAALGSRRASLWVVPMGVGSLAHAAVVHARGEPGDSVVLGVEPTSAPSVIQALHAGQPCSLQTEPTIMSGLCCGTVSSLAWPILEAGLSAATTVSELDAARAVRDLEALGVDAGPCGAATLAGARTVLPDEAKRRDLGISDRSVIILVSTEGRAANPLPPEVRSEHPRP